MTIPAISFSNVAFNGKALTTYSPEAVASQGNGGVTYEPGPITHGGNFTVSPVTSSKS